jgi:hypothetical protein
MRESAGGPDWRRVGPSPTAARVACVTGRDPVRDTLRDAGQRRIAMGLNMATPVRPATCTRATCVRHRQSERRPERALRSAQATNERGPPNAGPAKWSRGDSNPRALGESLEQDVSSTKRAARSAPRSKDGASSAPLRGPTGEPVPPTSQPVAAGGDAQADPDVARLAAAWADLPRGVRATIVAARDVNR